MKQFLLKFSFFQNWLADVWNDGWESGESWDSSGGLDMKTPKNPYL